MELLNSPHQTKKPALPSGYMFLLSLINYISNEKSSADSLAVSGISVYS